MEEKNYYTIPETAALIKINRQIIQTMCREGKIEGAFQVGHIWVIPVNWVKQYILPEGYISAPKAAALAGVSRWGMQKAIEAGKVDSLKRIFTGKLPLIYVNVSNAKWNAWLSEAQERSARYKK